jgi:hypothetical protein
MEEEARVLGRQDRVDERRCDALERNESRVAFLSREDRPQWQTVAIDEFECASVLRSERKRPKGERQSGQQYGRGELEDSRFEQSTHALVANSGEVTAEPA